MGMEVFHRLGVYLDGVKVNVFPVIEVFRQHPHAGTYFQYMRSEAGKAFGNLERDVLVFEKMLAQGFFCTYFHITTVLFLGVFPRTEPGSVCAPGRRKGLWDSRG